MFLKTLLHVQIQPRHHVFLGAVELMFSDLSRVRIELHWSPLQVKFAVSFRMVSPTWSALTTVKSVCVEWFSPLNALSTRDSCMEQQGLPLRARANMRVMAIKG